VRYIAVKYIGGGEDLYATVQSKNYESS
jgi:hypothetical protein